MPCRRGFLGQKAVPNEFTSPYDEERPHLPHLPILLTPCPQPLMPTTLQNDDPAPSDHPCIDLELYLNVYQGQVPSDVFVFLDI